MTGAETATPFGATAGAVAGGGRSGDSGAPAGSGVGSAAGPGAAGPGTDGHPRSLGLLFGIVIPPLLAVMWVVVGFAQVGLDDGMSRFQPLEDADGVQTTWSVDVGGEIESGTVQVSWTHPDGTDSYGSLYDPGDGRLLNGSSGVEVGAVSGSTLTFTPDPALVNGTRIQISWFEPAGGSAEVLDGVYGVALIPLHPLLVLPLLLLTGGISFVRGARRAAVGVGVGFGLALAVYFVGALALALATFS